MKINVGGEIFETTRQTLIRVPDSRLERGDAEEKGSGGKMDIHTAPGRQGQATARKMAWMKLNVGGGMFETTRQTLTKIPDSLLGGGHQDDK